MAGRHAADSGPRQGEKATLKSPCVATPRMGTQEPRACNSRGRSLAHARLAAWSGGAGDSNNAPLLSNLLSNRQMEMDDERFPGENVSALGTPALPAGGP